MLKHRIAHTHITDVGVLTVAWHDDVRKSFHPMWLRDNCLCAKCRHANGQKLTDISSWPPDIRVASVVGDDHGVRLRFAPDHPDHETYFDAEWLRHFTDDNAPRKQLWDAHSLNPDKVARDYDTIASTNSVLGEWLGFVLRYGFALLHGAPKTPTTPATVCAVAEWFSHTRETNYGRAFEVKAVDQPNNLAYTGMALAAHTDNPYRDPPPALQLLHCLQNTRSGGDSFVVDGFMAAQVLRRENPAHFDALACHAVPFQFADSGADLQNRLPVLEIAAGDGQLRAVNFNNRALGAIDIAFDEQPQYYAAYRHFDEILRRTDLAVTFTLRAGDLFIVDNRRVLHGRTGFQSGGGRHLQGCYAEADGLMSTWRLINARPGERS